MSFSIMTLPTPATASQQVATTFNANIDTASIEGRLLNVCIVDGSTLKLRAMQYSVGLLHTPPQNLTQIALATGVPSVISLVGSVLSPVSLNFDMPSNGTLRYTGTDSPNNRCCVHVDINFYATVNTQQMTFQLRRNGINVTGSTQTLIASNGITTINNSTLQALVSCSTNDYFDVTVTNSTNNNPIIIYNMALSAQMNFS